MRSYPTILVLAVCIVGNNRQRSFVQTAPLDAVSDNDKQSFEPSRSGSIINDEAVEELRHLKGNALTSDSSNGGSISVVKTHSAVFTNMNGKQEGHAEMKEQVNKNGEMFAKVEQKVDAKEDPKAGSPNTHVLTAVDIPSKGIHRVFSSEPGEKNLNLANLPAKATTTKRRVVSPASLNRFEGDDTQFPLSQMDGFTKTPLPLNAQYSPLDVAEYVFWTGDEKGVTMAVEEYLKQGLMTREEAISFLQDIQFNLDYLQLHYNDYNKYKNEERNREKNRQLEKILGLAERYREELQSPHSSADLKDIRAQMRLQNYEKKSDYSSFINDPRTKQAAPTSDEDYEEVLEKLKVADFLYNEYSMEDMVYQLAKVMFTQTLRRSSAEAQEALQKFTDFLESEAEQGRISRTLEKKVLDVLVAALTDTLNEHPELTSAAREGFGRDNSPDSGFSHQSFYRNSMSSKSSEKFSLAESPKSLQKGKVHETSAKKPLDMVMKKRNIHTSGIEDGEKV